MSTGGALNLSLLSRGVGEVSRNGHEKVDVIFEPQDYFNFVDSRRYYLPPIHSHVTFNTNQDISARSSGRPVKEIYLPKTFTTRKGALLLFSEDLAHRTRQADFKRHSHHKGSEQDSTDLSESAEDNDIKTVEDLTKSILSYGKQGKEREENDVYLKFVHSRRRDYFDRQIRPGFSAKRYLSTWTKSWDDSVLEKVISKGYLTEKSLFYYNPLLPHLSRRLNDDMSHYPAPYKLMRSMLMSPGSLSGYTFYRIRPESAETVEIAIEDGRATRVSIKVLSTKDGVQKEVTYASLDRKGQEEVLTDLLVKSAVHYAIKKQQEYMEEYLDVGVPTQVPIPEFDMKNAVESLLETEQYVAPHGTTIIEPDFPEIDSRSQSSTYSGSFKGTRVKRKYSSHEKQEKVHSKAAQADIDERDDGDYDMRSNFTSSIPQLPPVPHGPNLVLTPIGEASREHTQALSLPPVMRNGKDGEKIPAVNVQPPTPQHSILSNLPASRGMPRDGNLATTPEIKEDNEEDRWSDALQEREYQQQLRRQREQDEKREHKAKHRAKVAQQNIQYDAVSAEGKGMLPSGGPQLLSSSESLVGGSSQSTSSKALHRSQGWKGSTQSLRSHGSRKGKDSRTAVTVSPHQSRTSSALEQSPGSTAEDGSLRGSIIFGPDGEPILIGGKIAPTHKHQDPLHISEVQYANKHHTRDTSDESDAEVPDEWRTRQRIRSEKLSENLMKYAHKRDEEEREVTPVENHRSEHGSSQPVSIASSVVESPKSSVTEKEIVDALTEHAQKIAENILSSQDAGQNLEKDIRVRETTLIRVLTL
ncbi:hypothetical protein ACJMK2_014703 [Sinanodonta woodiana]|uniref:Uncharacterized protein n=1 Tax=Sinanodonta woodiana TaxID=1069815 RepID=A0ABD3V254_SINWO